MSTSSWARGLPTGLLLVAVSSGCSTAATKQPAQSSPLLIALETVLRVRMPGDSSWVVALDTASLRGASPGHDLSPADLRARLDGLVVLGMGCTDIEPCVTVGVKSVEVVEGGYLLGMTWTGTGGACGDYSARFHVSVAAGGGEVLSVTDEIEGICGPPQG